MARYGCEGDQARCGPLVLEEVKHNYKQLRTSFAFLLGAINGYKGPMVECEKFYLDRVSLFKIHLEKCES